MGTTVTKRVLFPKKCTARQRALLHEFAERNNLKHFSTGTDDARRINIESVTTDTTAHTGDNDHELVCEIDEEEADGTTVAQPSDQMLCEIIKTHFALDIERLGDFDSDDDERSATKGRKRSNDIIKTIKNVSVSEWTTKTLELLEMERAEELAQSLDTLNLLITKDNKQSTSTSLTKASKRTTTTKRRGSALDGLKIVDVRGGLLGQTIVTLEVAKRKILGAEKNVPPLPTHSFTPHDVVRLRPSNAKYFSQESEDDGGNDDTKSPDFPTGVVYRIRDSSIELALEEIPDFLNVSPLRLEKLSNEQTHKKLVSAVQRVQRVLSNSVNSSLGKDILGIVFENALPRVHHRVTSDDEGLGEDQGIRFNPFNENLDASQKKAIQLCLDCVDIGIIHGPPGTGKTTAVVEYVSQEVARGNRVLVCSASNVAVDNVVERLSDIPLFRTATLDDNKKKVRKKERRKKGNDGGIGCISAHKPMENQSKMIVRYGHPARLAPSVLDASLDAYILRSDDSVLAKECSEDAKKIRTRITKLDYRKKEDRAERNDLRKELRELAKEEKKRQKLAQIKTLENASVICSTLAGALSFMLKNEEFDVIVIDEAAQALECAVLGIVEKGKKLVLAGDHLQLPPTVLSDQASKKGLSVTLFERLVRNKQFGSKITTMLNTQYRMHESIMIWSSDAMYDSKLMAAESVRFRKFDQFENVLTLIDTTGADENFKEIVGDDDDDSKSNIGEAEIVMRTVEKFLSEKYKILPSEIGVITPYSGQVSLLREMRAVRSEENEIFKDVEISTVDGFQGREKEAIIISTVRSNETNEVGFLSDERRMNVAITRARKHVTLICNCETVSKNKFLANLVRYFEDHGELISSAQFSE
jgi:ATP-dependent RNA/DNA helicase IGHMBP2